MHTNYGLSGDDYYEHIEEDTPKKVQPRDEKGRFKPYDEVEKQKNEEPEEWDDDEPEFTDFSQLDREELVQIIEENDWDDEIDVENTPTRKLVKFLEKKENKMFNDNTEDEDEKDVREAIRETLDRNPERILKLLKAIFDL